MGDAKGKSKPTERPGRRKTGWHGSFVPDLLTPGKIAAELGVPVHRVVYVLDTRPHIRPLARAGGLRVYHRDSLAEIRHELTAIEARRKTHHD